MLLSRNYVRLTQSFPSYYEEVKIISLESGNKPTSFPDACLRQLYLAPQQRTGGPRPARARATGGGSAGPPARPPPPASPFPPPPPPPPPRRRPSAGGSLPAGRRRAAALRPVDGKAFPPQSRSSGRGGLRGRPTCGPGPGDARRGRFLAELPCATPLPARRPALFPGRRPLRRPQAAATGRPAGNHPPRSALGRGQAAVLAASSKR